MHQPPNHIGNGSAVPYTPRQLPFVGRDKELERIADFVQSTIAGNSLGLLWLQGEAGVGKSRFLEHVRTVLTEQGNLVIYVRLYPDSALSIIQAFSGAIAAHPRLRQLLPESELKTLASLTGALRRSAHLRPTLLIIDDVHLLDSEAANELIEVTDALQNEPISILCAARPGSTPAYTALFHQPMRYVEIGPLAHEDVRQILRQCYGSQYTDDTTLARVYETTQGIPLIIRAAMAECLHKDSEKLLYLSPPAVPPPGFHTKARLASEALVSCLTSELSVEERQGTELLALLGEVFSREAAIAILGNRPELLDIYIKNQIISPALGQPQPLFESETSVDTPLAFTHSLLHQQLTSQSSEHIALLINTIESGIPLFSIHPLLYLAQAPKELVLQALNLLLDYTEQLADSVNRGLATSVFNGAVSLYEEQGSTLSEEVQLDIRLTLIRLRLQITAHIPEHPDFVSTLTQFLTLTESPNSELLAGHRLAALEYSTFRVEENWEDDLFGILEEAEYLLDDFPTLQTHKHYHRLLGSIAAAARPYPNSQIIRTIRQQLEALLNTPPSSLPAEVRQNILTWVAGQLLPVFSSHEELLDRRYLAALIQNEFGEHPRKGRLSTIWPQFLEVSGDVLKARLLLQSAINQPMRGYNLSNEISLRLLVLSSDAALGRDLKHIERDVLHLVEESNAHFGGLANDNARLLIRTSIVGSVLLVGLLRGASGWSRNLVRALCGDDAETEIDYYLHFERAAIEEDQDSVERLFRKEDVPSEYHNLLTEMFADSVTSISTELTALLEKPILRRQDLLRIHVALGLGRIALKSGKISARVLKATARQAIEDALSWCSENVLPGYMEGLIRSYNTLLLQNSLIDWQEQREEHLLQVEKSAFWPHDNNVDDDTRLRLSMIGTIGFRDSQGTFQRISGARTRHVLGLLTACKLNGNNCSLEEFRRLATAMEDSDEAANYLRIILSRLRRLLGNEAILTIENSAPQLNIEHLHVDLIEVHLLLKEGMQGVHQNEPREAYNKTKEALEILGEDAILPTLYDEIFDKARHEFEIHLREVLFAVTAFLKEKNDIEHLIQILRMGVKTLPEDEELAELLASNLRSYGQQVEALRTESRSQESIAS
ncbi:MAG: AAA family ATPase [Candidatus Kapaibacterium sp.]